MSSLYDDSYVMVASIDFGTTFSGYAFSFRANKNDIRMNRNWGQEAGHQSFKTPTSVLLDPRGNMLAFGYAAETKYNELITSEGEDSCELYRHFKMTLHSEKHLTRKSRVQSVRGNHADAMLIFTYAVKFLKDHLLEAVKKSIVSAPDPDLIRWVITVPAIWSEESKSFMREVAFKAGLTNSINSRQFIICLEPEAASIFCRQLETDQFSKGGNNATQLLHKTGTRYMIVDAGGGTIDIAVHEILEGGSVKELDAASGGPWGGTKVDHNFIELLKRVLGEEFIIRYQKECPSEWLEIRVNFENRKKSVLPDDPNALMAIPLNWGICAKYQEVTGKSIEKVLRSTTTQGVKFKNGSIVFDSGVVRSLFEPVTTRIISHLRDIVRSPKARGVSMILLNGGFGECAYLQSAITKAFSPGISVACPSEAGITIIKGAVLFGHSPKVIDSRIARKTYGTDSLIPFNPAKHDRNRKITDELGQRCLIFDKFITKGDDVNTDEEWEFTYRPGSSKQTSMVHKFFSADTESPLYIDEHSVKEIGKLRVDIPDTTGGIDREIRIRVHFGATEIRVESYQTTKGGDGHRAETSLDFLTE